MDTRTGEIVTKDVLDALPEDERQHYIEMQVAPTPEQLACTPFPKVGRNDLCPCGSGKKFKHCHWQGRHPTTRKPPITS
jgi:uncharacterized protein YecA (UPF0149 family)